MASRRFEALLRPAFADGLLADLRRIDIHGLGELSGWMAAVHPDGRTRALTVTHAGPTLSAIQGDPMIGMNYLNLVDPAIRGDAFDSAFVMLTRPCGLWQVSPVLCADGADNSLEFTGFPAYDPFQRCGVVVFMLHLAGAASAAITRVGPALRWQWLEVSPPALGRCRPSAARLAG